MLISRRLISLPYDAQDPERWSIHNLTKIDLSKEISLSRGLQFTDMRGATFARAHLHGAFLSGADLSQTDFSNADLRGAELTGCMGITNEELEKQTSSLKGATMPNGQKYEDWLKDKEGGGEDGGPQKRLSRPSEKAD